ncbi:MAG: hypothetical protein AB7P23_05515 [Amphiplicatus sp.]
MANEFKGATLEEAVRAAVAMETRRRTPRLGNYAGDGRCNDLILEISDLKREAGRLSDAAARLEREADALRRSAARTLTTAALSALAGLAGSARGVSAALRILSQRSVRSISRGDILGLLSLLGPLGAAAGALYAASDLLKARQLADDAEEIERRAESIGDDLLTAVDQYDRIGCGAEQDIA